MQVCETAKTHMCVCARTFATHPLPITQRCELPVLRLVKSFLNPPLFNIFVCANTYLPNFSGLNFRVIGEKFDRARTFFGGCLMACANRVSPDVVQPGTYKIEIKAQQEESKLSERMINFFLYSSNFLLLVS